MDVERVVVVAHGHPDLRRGGAEMVAGHLVRGLRRRGVQTLFVARAPEPGPEPTPFSTRSGGDDVLFHTSTSDHFLFRCARPEHVWRDFAGLLERFRPQVIHFQHFVHMGIELIRQARLSCPRARIVSTLHEFLPICAHQGQMVQTRTLEPCERSSPAACARCFPERSPADFFLRQRYLQSVLADVDLFLSPSRFLAQRYVDWGVAAERIQVLENGQPETARLPPRPLAGGAARDRFAFFGQLNPFKGVDLLLEASSLLRAQMGDHFSVDIHGANLAAQPGPFRERMRALTQPLSGIVTLHGEYEPQRLGALMAEIDWVVVPSIWWENSPMVIQEAYAHGRPVIAADIGGMREKVREGAGGLRFCARDARSLAAVMRRASDPATFDAAVATLPRPLDLEAWLDAHLSAYAPTRA